MKKILKWGIGLFVLFAIIGAIAENNDSDNVSEVAKTVEPVDALAYEDDDENLLTEEQDILQMVDYLLDSSVTDLGSNTLLSLSELLNSVNNDANLLKQSPYDQQLAYVLSNMRMVSEGFMITHSNSTHPKAIEFEKRAHTIGENFSLAADTFEEGVRLNNPDLILMAVSHVNIINEETTKLTAIVNGLNQ